MNKIIVLFLITFVLFGQKVSKKEEENRLLLIITTTKNNSDFINQMQVLSNNNNEFKERKLKIIQVLPQRFKSISDENWNTSSNFYQKFNAEKAPFKVVLIGLDGGIKLSQTKILTTEHLFKTIDGMPMRMREIRNQN